MIAKKTGLKKFLSTVLVTTMVLEPWTGVITSYAQEKESTANAEKKLIEMLETQSVAYPDGGFEFYGEEQTITEDEKEIEISVVRLGDAKGTDSVEVKAVNLTALYGEDYEIAESDKDGCFVKKMATNTTEVVTAEEPDEFQEEVGKETEVTVIPMESKPLSLKSAKETQTGVESDWENWRDAAVSSTEPTDAQLVAASMAAENEIVNAVDGNSIVLEFAEGEYKKVIRFIVKDDELAETTETAYLMLGNVEKGMVGTKSQLTVNIEDNEAPEDIIFGMKAANVYVEAGADKAQVVIERTSGINYFSSVKVSTAAISAVPNGDYIPLNNREVIFQPGETEKIIDIPLAGKNKESVEFEVRLHTEQSNVAEGKQSTIVSVKGTEAEVIEGVSKDATAQAYKSGTVRENIGGVNYTVYKLTGFNQAAATSNNQWSGWKYFFSGYMPGLTRINVDYRVDGRNKRGLIWYYQKEVEILMNNSRVLYHDIGDKKANRTKYYNEAFTVNQAHRNSGEFLYHAGSYWWNNKCYVDINEVKMYYPDYTISFQNDSSATYKPKTYTAKGSYKEDAAVTLGTSPSGGTITKDGSSLRIASNCIDGAYVEKYKIYCKNSRGQLVELGSTTSNYLYYSDLTGYLGSHQSTMTDGKYQIVITPVYKTYPAKVKFEVKDTSLNSFTGGFKNTDVLNCTRLDKVTVKGSGNSNATIGSLTIGGNYTTEKSLNDNTLNSVIKYPSIKDTKKAATEGSATLEATFSVKNSYNVVALNNMNPTIKLQYDPDEVNDTAMRDAGLVALYPGDKKPEDVRGSDYETPIVMAGIDMSIPYMATFIKGEKALTVEAPFQYKALWTYKTENGEYKTVTGENYVFKPYYGYTLIDYYFKKVHADATQVGVSGTVSIQETPLFSSQNNSTKAPLGGATLNIGGQTVTTNTNGQYKTKNVFNKGEYVGIYMSYDTMYKVDNLDISKNRTYNPIINVNENDKIKVEKGQILKHEPTGSSIAGGSGVGNTKPTYPTVVFIEDAAYELSVQTQGTSGVEPEKVEFRFYDKSGTIKEDFTQTVQVDANKKATLKINPMSVETTSGKKSLSVGDFMTVKAFDKKGQGYFEHQTTIILSEKPASLYMFNYNGWKKEDDNAFIQAIGGISLGYDLVINSLANSFGSYEDENSKMHYLYGIGFGDGYQSVNDPEFTKNAYVKEQQIINQIKNGEVINENLRQGDGIPINGSGDGKAGWGFELEIGVIMDVVLGDGNDRTVKGAWYFRDFVLIGNLNGSYSNNWTIPVGPVDAHLKLGFEVADSGIKWHFTGGDSKYQVANNSTITLMETVENEGRIDIHAKVSGSAYIGKGTSNKAFVGLGGSLDIILDTYFANLKDGNTAEKVWVNEGVIEIKPAVKIKVSVLEIPLWSETFRGDWKLGDAHANAVGQAVDKSLEDADILEVSTASPVVIDRNYLNYASAWSGKDLASSYSISDASGVKETTVKTGIYSESKIKLQDLGNGKYLGVFTDDPNVEGYDTYRSALYYTIFDGEGWSEPKLIEDDKTNDELPVIHEAGDMGYLIAWSDGAHTMGKDATTMETLNDFNISGVFYQPETGTMSEVMEITKETKADKVADSNPQIAYYEGDLTGRTLMVYYTKSEYAAADETKGETVGDILSPYSVIAYRFYDFATNTWSETYKDSDKADIIGTGENVMTEEEYKAYVEDWYGQVFLDLAPVVSISEKINPATDRWSETPVIGSYKGQNDPVVTDSAMISFNALSLMAYVLDEDGNTSTTGDRNIYVQIYNMKDDEVHHAIRLTTGNSKLENLQFLREDGATYLYWLQDGVIMKQDVSNLVTNCLIKATDEKTGLEYYYIDRSETNDYYQEPMTVADVGENDTEDATIEEETEEAVTVTEETTENTEIAEDERIIKGFTAYTNDEYSYVVWTEQIYNTELKKHENQLFITREKISTHETTLPVQITETSGAVYQQAEFVVNEESGLNALTTRFTTKENGALDTSTGELVALSFNPKKAVSIQNITYGEPFAGKLVESDEGTELDERIFVPVQVEIENSSVEAIEDGMILVSGTDDAQSFALIGGERAVVAFDVPVDELGNYKYTITVKDGSQKLLAKKQSGKLAANISLDEFKVELTERDEVKVSGIVKNTSVFNAPESTVEIGYTDAEGKKQVLTTVNINALKVLESVEVEQVVKCDFDTMFKEAQLQEDGTYRSNLSFYMSGSEEGTTTLYAEKALEATAEQMELMKTYETVTTSLLDSDFKVGEVSHAVVLVTGETVNKEPEELGIKVKWNEDKAGIVNVNEDGSLTATKAGTTTITGYVMPQNTVYEYADANMPMVVDNYATLPKETIKEVSMKVVVGKGAQEQPTATPEAEKISITKAKVSKLKDRVYTGKTIKPAVTVKYNGKTLKKDTDYTVTYKANKAIGTATVIIKGKGNYSGEQKVTFKIVPGKVSGMKVSKAGKLTWKKLKGSVQYEVRYATKKNGSYKLLTTTKKTGVSLSSQKKLKAGKNYYVKVRAFKKVNGKKVYGAYSAAKKYTK